MGRQSARLWHDGKDHKDIWKLIVDEENASNNAWRMHWQIYKGNRLLWEKLPPNFMAVCRKSHNDTDYYYGSDDGKRFTNYGFCIDYCNDATGIRLRDFCKVGKYIFSIGYAAGICYTTNFYLWKTLDVKFDFFKGEDITHIENYNERLLIMTRYKILTYDIRNNEIKYIPINYHNGIDQFDFAGAETYAFGNTLLVKCRKTVKITDVFGIPSSRKIEQLLVFKDDVLVKTFSEKLDEYGNTQAPFFGAKSLTGDGNTAYMIGSEGLFTGYGNRNGILSSKDGLTWKSEENNYVAYEAISCTKKGLYAFYPDYGIEREYVIYKLENGSLKKIENRVNARAVKYDRAGINKLLAFEAEGYMYANAIVLVDGEEKLCFVRFKNFESEECEILSEMAFFEGIYVENWEG